MSNKSNLEFMDELFKQGKMSAYEIDMKYGIPVNSMRQCTTCKNIFEGTTNCKAFPQGIPEELLEGKWDHTEPYPGDNGILYDPVDPENPASAPFARNKKK